MSSRRSCFTLLSLAVVVAALASASVAGAGVIKSGTLTPLNGEVASASVSLVRLTGGRKVLRLANARIGEGPALRVYLVAGTVRGNADVRSFKDLGKLKGSAGTQQYTVPAGVNTDRYTTVVIWCRDFSVAFGKAVLRRAS
jgi:hypothetical protein